MIQLYKVKNKPGAAVGSTPVDEHSLEHRNKGRREMGGPEPLQGAAPRPTQAPQDLGQSVTALLWRAPAAAPRPSQFVQEGAGACPSRWVPGRSQVRGVVW